MTIMPVFGFGEFVPPNWEQMAIST